MVCSVCVDPPGSMTYISCITKSTATTLGLKQLVSHFTSECQTLSPLTWSTMAGMCQEDQVLSR